MSPTREEREELDRRAAWARGWDDRGLGLPRSMANFIYLRRKPTERRALRDHWRRGWDDRHEAISRHAGCLA